MKHLFLRSMRPSRPRLFLRLACGCALAAGVILTGCETGDAPSAYWNQEGSTNGTAAVAAPSGSGETAGTGAAPASGGTGSISPVGGMAVPADFSGVVWLHTDVSGWAPTASLSVSFSGDYIHLNYDKAKVWPDSGGVNANPWVFVWKDGVWYAATWEWLSTGQTSKPKNVVDGAHIKKSELSGWAPVSGGVYGFMVSGLARTSQRNVLERSGVVMVRWP
jgi:hypothetical protein